MLVCSLGDLVLDVIVRLQQPLAPGGDATSRITLAAGGQAANVAAWVAVLGADARWLGCRGADDAGHIAGERLAACGVELCGPISETGGGIVVSLVAPDGERTMCPDRGAGTELRPEDVDVGALAGADWLHVSSYALFVEPVRSAALRAVELARLEGARVSVDLASWSGIRDVGVEPFRAILDQLEPDVVFANEDETRSFGSPLAGPLWVEKRGAAGCAFGHDEREALPVDQVVDTTGAGDALAAGWLVGGPDLALEAAARCVQQAGAMP